MSRRLDPEAIPADFEVQPTDRDGPATNPCTCGTCGLTWDDWIVTSMTPAPSGRCPFEAFHDYRPDYERPHNVVVPFENAHGAFSFLAEVDELGYRAVVVGVDGEQVDADEYEEGDDAA
jgi:hypothetical protein